MSSTDLGVLKKCAEFEKNDVQRTVRIRNYAAKIDSLLYSYCPDLQISRSVINGLFADKTWENYLDIHCRSGEKMQDLYRASQRITAIEILPEYLKGIISCCPHVQAINASIAEIDLPETYDLITWDHGLYYHAKDTWAPLCKKIYDSLRPGGYFCLLMNDVGTDWYRTLETFSDLNYWRCFHYMPISKLEEELKAFAQVGKFNFNTHAILPQESDPGLFIGKQILEISEEKIYQENHSRFVEFAQSLTKINGKRIFNHLVTGLVLSKPATG